jgi:hypothetical protein
MCGGSRSAARLTLSSFRALAVTTSPGCRGQSPQRSKARAGALERQFCPELQPKGCGVSDSKDVVLSRGILGVTETSP